jgi:hypothetical protein
LRSVNTGEGVTDGLNGFVRCARQPEPANKKMLAGAIGVALRERVATSG